MEAIAQDTALKLHDTQGHRAALQKLQEEEAALIADHFNHEERRWYSNKHEAILATDEETSVYQAIIRGFRWRQQFLNEEMQLCEAIDYVQEHPSEICPQREIIANLKPLVSRRLHPELWEKIHKTALDGDQFTFFPPMGTTAYVLKHRIGNRNCAACMTKMPKKINTTEDAVAAVSATERDIEWCPRFLRVLRLQPIREYLSTVKDNATCYAGLLHSQMSIDTTEEGTFLTVFKMCDTCGYMEETRTKLEGYQEQEVQEGDQFGSAMIESQE